MATFSIDLCGANIYYLCDSDAVSGLGHAAVIIGNETIGYTYYSFGSENSSGSNVSGSGSSGSDSTGTGFTANTLSEIFSDSSLDRYKNSEGQMQYIEFVTTYAQDMKAYYQADTSIDDAYWLLFNNCLDFVKNILDAAGVDYNNALTPEGFYKANE